MRKFNARHFMEMAIEVMRNSIPEPRSDGKASPKVGAVLVDVGDNTTLPDPITTAYRGELRHGDHAEFTLLERKHRSHNLDQCVLFATLEPCAPNARKHPKLGCAERIVLARIKEVWVGIEDPDPTVDRKGIKYLQDNGVTVHMFDADLQEIIREENKQFIAQALDRAAKAAEQQPTEIILSPLESALAHSQLNDFSPNALAEYQQRATIPDSSTSDEFKRRFVNQGLLKLEGNRYVPTGFGMLLFGVSPRTTMPQAGVLATIHYANGKEEINDFDGPQVLVPDQVVQWLHDKLPNFIDRTKPMRTEESQLFLELVREGIVNALVHRNYDIAGAKCQLHISEGKVEIRSPGEPVAPITIEQMQSFEAPALSRNPVIHYVFAKMKMAEERGLGLKSMREKARANGLPTPRYSWVAPFLVLTLFATPQATTTTLPPKVRDALTASERKGWEWLSTQGRAKSSDYSKALDVGERTAQRHLKRFLELDLVRLSGSGPTLEYVVR